jgi:hypothetical protein
MYLEVIEVNLPQSSCLRKREVRKTLDPRLCGDDAMESLSRWLHGE